MKLKIEIDNIQYESHHRTVPMDELCEDCTFKGKCSDQVSFICDAISDDMNFQPTDYRLQTK